MARETDEGAFFAGGKQAEPWDLNGTTLYIFDGVVLMMVSYAQRGG